MNACISKHLHSLLEYNDQSEVIGLSIADFTHPEDIKKDFDLLQEIRTGKRYCFQIEKRYITKKHNIVWVDLQVSVVRNEDGQIVNFVGMVSNITEKKHRESDFFSSEERLSLATTHAGIGIWDWDIKQDILIWDDLMFELYDVKKINFSGVYKAWEKALHKDDVDSVNKEIVFNSIFRSIK